MSIIQIFHGQGSNKRLFKITSNQRLKKRIEVCIRTNLGNGLNIFFLLTNTSARGNECQIYHKLISINKFEIFFEKHFIGKHILKKSIFTRKTSFDTLKKLSNLWIFSHLDNRNYYLPVQFPDLVGAARGWGRFAEISPTVREICVIVLT